MIRVLIVDDHQLFRDGLQAIFLLATDIEVVGEASNGKEAIKKAETLQPDIILMDIQMDDMSGIEATRLILKDNPNIFIIMLTMLEGSDSLYAAMRAGARNYILKGADKNEVLRTIRAAAQGEVLLGAQVAERFSSFFHDNQHNQPPSPFPELTEREHEILDLIAQGKSNGDIAEELSIASKTVSNHISNIFNKLQVVDRAQAVIKARDAGMGKKRD